MNGAFFLRPGVWLMRRLHLGGKLLLLERLCSDWQ